VRPVFDFFFSWNGLAGQSQSGSDPVELTDAWGVAEAFLQGALDDRTGGARRFLTGLNHKGEHLSTQFDGMPMPPIDQAARPLRLDPLEQAIHGGPMHRNGALNPGHVCGYPLFDLPDDLTLRGLALGGGNFGVHRSRLSSSLVTSSRCPCGFPFLGCSSDGPIFFIPANPLHIYHRACGRTINWRGINTLVIEGLVVYFFLVKKALPDPIAYERLFDKEQRHKSDGIADGIEADMREHTLKQAETPVEPAEEEASGTGSQGFSDRI